MKKWSTRLSWIQLLLLLFLANSTLFADPQGNYFHSQEKGFSITFPSNWETKENFMGCIIAGLSPQQNSTDTFRSNVNVVVEPLPNSMNADEYCQGNLKSMNNMLTDFKKIESSSVNINNTTAKRIVYVHRMGKIKLKVLAYFFTKGENGYVVTCTSTPNQFAAHVKQFEQIASTFKLD